MHEKVFRFPAVPGTYLLILRLPRRRRLRIGALGERQFAAGWYLYVGSAFGPGGLAARLRHHCHGGAKPHWHIDYLRQAARLLEVWYAADAFRHESEWAALLAELPGATVPVARFGASDARAGSHLVHLSTRPAFEDWQQRVGQACERWIAGLSG